MYGVFPRCVDFRRHKTCISQADLVHAVGYVGDTQALKKFQDLPVFFGPVDLCRNEVLAGPKFLNFRLGISGYRQERKAHQPD